MSARVESILGLLRMKFSTLHLSATAGQYPREIEQRIANAVFESLQSYDHAESFEVEQNDEVTDCDYPQDEDFIPVYESFGVDREFFTFEYKGLMRTWCQTIFKEILDRTHTDNCVLYLDSWGGQRDPGLFQLDGKQINIKTFPPGTTSLIQPLDVYCFQMWKNFAKRMTRACAMIGHRIDRRDDALRLQSLIYNQFQHPDFRAMWLCGWHQAGFDVPAIPFPSIGAMLFDVGDACSVAHCRGIGFIRCVHCKAELCVECFFIKFHVHG